jgi:transcriptional regulator
MSTRKKAERDALLQGTLDLLILRVLERGPEHGQGIGRAIEEGSAEVLLVEHGSLYPALQRLERRGWVRGKWGVSQNGRRARFYELTAKGRRQLTDEAGRWRRVVEAVGRVLGPELKGG